MDCERNIKDGENEQVPIWNKYMLTINEAVIYFNIGESKLRSMISLEPYAKYILRNGNKVLIKRKMFEEYIDEAYSI